MSGAIPASLLEQLSHQLSQVVGFIYPNEVETQWAILIVVYPYLTGIVAGAFILASLVKVFNVVEVQSIYRLALLTALSFSGGGTPLQLHLGHPERADEIFFTPQPTSAMAMFGFVYLWYLLGILLIEIWFEYRQQLVLMAQQSRGVMKSIYGALSLYSKDVSPESVAFDHRATRSSPHRHLSAFLLHGYVASLRLREGESLVGQRPDAHPLPDVGHRVGHRHGDVPVHLLSLVRNEKLDSAASTRSACSCWSRSSWTSPWRRSTTFTDATRARSLSGSSLELVSYRVVHEPGRRSVAARHAAAPADPRCCCQRSIQRGIAQAVLLHLVAAAAARDLQHALERRDRRPAVLEELPRPDGLQDGDRRASRAC